MYTKRSWVQSLAGHTPKVAGSVPGQEVDKRQPINVSLSLSPPLPPSLKSIHILSGEDLKKQKEPCSLQRAQPGKGPAAVSRVSAKLWEASPCFMGNTKWRGVVPGAFGSHPLPLGGPGATVYAGRGAVWLGCPRLSLGAIGKETLPTSRHRGGALGTPS